MTNNSQMTLEGHLKGVNTIAFCSLNDKPYLASGGDDFIIKIWDYTMVVYQYMITTLNHQFNISKYPLYQFVQQNLCQKKII